MKETMRICVLGNSHLAAAKHGWDQISARYPGLTLTFFGAPRNIMKDLVLEGTQLVPKTEKLLAKIQRSSGGLEAVEIRDYDAFILYGLQFGARRLIQLYRTHRPISFEWREPLPELAPMEARPAKVQTVSERLFEEAALSGLNQTLAVQLIAQLRVVSRVPIHLIAAPGFSERVLDGGDWDGMLGSGDLAQLEKRYCRLAELACPLNVELHMAPADRVAHGLFTRREHASDMMTESGPDLVHTNAEYGAAMLELALRDLSSLAEREAGSELSAAS